MKESILSETGSAKNEAVKIADEEKSHYKVMENIIEFITMPERWFEDAEFSIGEDF